MKVLNCISHYYETRIHSKRKTAPARMEDTVLLREAKKPRHTLKEFYLPGPGGYGCVPVIKYSSSCPEEQQNVVLIITFHTALQMMYSNRK